MDAVSVTTTSSNSYLELMVFTLIGCPSLNHVIDGLGLAWMTQEIS